MTANVDIALRNNEDWRDTFVLVDMTLAAQPPINLDDAALTLHVRESATAQEAVFIASTVNDKIQILDGTLFRVTMTNTGSSYETPPTIAFTGGGSDPDKVLPTGLAVLGTEANADKVVAVTITDRGFNLTEAPSVGFSGGGGADAAATATLGPTCVIDVDWAEIAHLAGSYAQDLVLTVGDLRKVIWAGTFEVDQGVTR